MADETTSTWAELMREAKGPLQEALKYKTVLLSEVKRDKNARRWHGKQVTIPIFTSPQQGAGGISQTGTVNDAITVDVEQASITSGIVAIPVAFSTQVLKQSQGDENVWAEVLPTKMQRAEDAFGRVINEMMTGFGVTADGGTALLAAVAANVSASGGASQTINVGTSANLYQLYVGRVVDVRVRSTGALVSGSTMPVKITAVNRTTGVITVVNIDGSATSFATASATDGVYIQGTYRSGELNALQGLGQAAARTGTFEGINKANVEAWQGIDASPAAATDPSIAIFDKSEREVMARAGKLPDFYLADPAVIDKYTQGLTVQARWAGEEGQLESGWTGVRYRNKLLVPDYDMKVSTAIGVPLEDMAIYTLDDGPDWDEMTGSMFQRFGTRSLPVEAWLVWMLQFGFHACNGIVEIGNLNRAS